MRKSQKDKNSLNHKKIPIFPDKSLIQLDFF